MTSLNQYVRPKTPSGVVRSRAAALQRACGQIRKYAIPGLILLASTWTHLHAQTLEDGFMVNRKHLFTGVLYTHDSWDEYWEGSLKRVNGNIGTITTQTTTWFGNYGITDKLNVISTVPYVWTRASQGVLHSMNGFQDITVGAKYQALELPFTELGSLRVYGAISGSTPLTDYSPDFQPLSIGLGSKRLSGRLTLHFQSKTGWFLTGSAAHTWRGNVKLDRPFYFTENRLFLTNTVDMPNVFDYSASAGYVRKGLMIPITYSQQSVLGGSDIRRQDSAFVSNRMNYSRLGAMVMYTIPKLKTLAFQGSFSYVMDGRNVGQASTITAGFLYTFSIGR
jgi:hypothetical protein